MADEEMKRGWDALVTLAPRQRLAALATARLGGNQGPYQRQMAIGCRAPMTISVGQCSIKPARTKADRG